MVTLKEQLIMNEMESLLTLKEKREFQKSRDYAERMKRILLIQKQGYIFGKKSIQFI